MNLTVICDCCNQSIEGTETPEMTGGFYKTGPEHYWHKYAQDESWEIICDRCMHASPKYRADYGDLTARPPAAQRHSYRQAKTNTDRFYAHLYECDQCRNSPLFDPCCVGAELQGASLDHRQGPCQCESCKLRDQRPVAALKGGQEMIEPQDLELCNNCRHTRVEHSLSGLICKERDCQCEGFESMKGN